MSEWWRGGVIYQIYPRSFQDSNGDGVGDLPGIINRLEHIASLGVDAVWLSPIFTSPMADMGYDVSNYKDIDPLFGTLADFDKLIEKAHGLGLKVIVDQVLSHTSDQHPWFKQSRSSRLNDYSDWYVWVDPNEDGTPPNNWQSVFGGSAWEWNATRRQYYLHNFLTSQPDLNFHNPKVQDAVLDVMRFWLERGLDGFRFDTVNYFFHDARLRDDPPAKRQLMAYPEVKAYDMQEHLYSKNRPDNLDFLKRIRALMDEFPDTMTVGEVGEDHHPIEVMARYTEGSERLHMAYSFAMLSPNFTPNHFRSCISEFFEGAPNGWPCWSFSNHDVIRHMTRWMDNAGNALDLAKQAAAMLLSFRGSVCLYQGEELGLTESDLEFEELTDPPGIRFWPEYKGRDGCRTPIPWESGEAPNGFTTGKPWLPVKAPQSALNVEDQNADENSVLAFYREMLAFRKQSPVLIEAPIAFVDAPETVLAYIRSNGKQALLCVFNLSPKPITLSAGGSALPSAAVLANGADLGGDKLKLAANGFVFAQLPADAALSLTKA